MPFLRIGASIRVAFGHRKAGFFSGCCVFWRRATSDNDFLCMHSELSRFHIAMLANDDVKQDHAGVFTFDPISRIEEWRAAMLADPSHIKKFSNDMPSRFAGHFFAQREALEVKGTQVSGW